MLVDSSASQRKDKVAGLKRPFDHHNQTLIPPLSETPATKPRSLDWKRCAETHPRDASSTLAGAIQ